MKIIFSRKALLFYGAAVFIAVSTWWFAGEGVMGRALISVESLQHWEAFALLLLYIPAAICFVPVFIISLAVGYLLDFKVALLVISVGSTVGSLMAFAVARTVAREFLEEKLAGHPKFQALDQAVASQAFKIVALSRIAPILSYNILNYMYGISRVRFRDYLWGTWLGMIPATIVLALLGATAQGIPEILANPRMGLAQHPGWIAGGVTATAVILWWVTRLVSQSLKLPDKADASRVVRGSV